MMFTMSSMLLSIFTYFLSTALAQTQGTITAPTPGTAIAPGAAFNFSYIIRADYCKSSYAYAVYLITALPTSLYPSDELMDGYYFGRFDEENYPAVPYAQNPAPAQLTMPNFSQPQGGFGGGESSSNATFYLTVFEEWDDCEGTVGRKLGLAVAPIVYNATSH